MSWYTDGEPFDEYEMSFCKGCTISESKAQCDACIRAHLGEDEEDEEMKDYVVESDFIYKGYRCVVIFGRLGFRCGYVGVDANNPLYKQSYHSGCLDIKKSELYGKPIGKRGVMTLLGLEFDTDDQVTLEQYFDVHGSLTYSDNNPEYPVNSELWWLGFDCGHYDDGIDGDLVREYWGEELHYPRVYDKYPVRSKVYVERECKSLVGQIIDLVGEPKE